MKEKYRKGKKKKKKKETGGESGRTQHVDGG